VKEAIEWISSSMDVSGKPHASSSAFEVTIRILGGLLSAVHVGGGNPILGGKEQILLKRATEVGVRLLSAFQTTSGIPFKDVDLQQFKGQQPGWTRFTSVADSCTLSMEFTSLSRVRIHSHTVLLIHHT
jgi:endoplasmic reticulum Man9GlcNAc2 1,2-alpha-mannosidase